MIKRIVQIFKDYGVVIHEMARSYWYYNAYERRSGALKVCRYDQCYPYAKPVRKPLKVNILYCMLWPILDRIKK
jgi:hypothetical protein